MIKRPMWVLCAAPLTLAVGLAGCGGGSAGAPDRKLDTGAASIAACIKDSTGGEPVSDKQQVRLSLVSHDAAAAKSLERRAAEISALDDSPYTYAINESISGSEEVSAKALTALRTGSNVPDIMGFDSQDFSLLMPYAADNLFDFTDYLGDTATDRVKSRDAVWSVDGHLYGVESGYGLGAYYYNADQFEKLGIDPADLKTWQDLIRVGTEKAVPKGQALLGVPTDHRMFLYLLSERGGSFFDADGNVTVNTPEAVEVLTMLKQGIDAGVIKPFSYTDFYGAGNFAAMQNHEVLGYAYPDWYLAYYMKPNVEDQAGEWRAQLMPRFEDGGFATGLASGHAWTVNKNGPNADAAALLIKCGQATTEAQVQMFLESGYLPHNASAFKDPRLVNYTDPFLGGQAVVKDVYTKAAADAPVINNSPYWNLAQQILGEEITNVLAGRKSVEAGLEDAQASIEEAIQAAQ